MIADEMFVTNSKFISTYLTNIMFGSGLYCPTGLLIAVKAKRSVSGPRGVLLEMLLHLKSNTASANEFSRVSLLSGMAWWPPCSSQSTFSPSSSSSLLSSSSSYSPFSPSPRFGWSGLIAIIIKSGHPISSRWLKLQTRKGGWGKSCPAVATRPLLWHWTRGDWGPPRRHFIQSISLLWKVKEMELVASKKAEEDLTETSAKIETRSVVFASCPCLMENISTQLKPGQTRWRRLGCPARRSPPTAPSSSPSSSSAPSSPSRRSAGKGSPW